MKNYTYIDNAMNVSPIYLKHDKAPDMADYRVGKLVQNVECHKLILNINQSINQFSIGKFRLEDVFGL